MSKTDIQEDSFSSDAEFEDDDDGSESSTDVDAKLEEDDVFDVEFLKCYSALKRKDEKIYDENVRFFSERAALEQAANQEASTSTNEADNTNLRMLPRMTLLDHQMNLKEEDLEDAEAGDDSVKRDINQPISKSFYDQQLDEIKKSIEKVSETIDSESDDELFTIKESTGYNKKRKSYRTISSLLDKIEEEEDEDISHLKEVWSDPKCLTKEDKYLRDYILNKRYLPSHGVDSDDDDDKAGFFSKNIDQLSDADSDNDKATDKPAKDLPVHHSDEKDFDTITRIPRNSTKTIRDLVEKREKKEKRLRRLEKEKKKKKSLKDADCEDILGDMPTKFHYRETEPNDYGLSAEELLMATDEELDKWISLKDAIAYKTKEEELAEKKKFESKRHDIALKKKIFKSLYGEPSESNDDPPRPKEVIDGVQPESNRKRKKRKNRGTNHKKFASGVAPDRLLAYGLSKTKLKKSKLL